MKLNIFAIILLTLGLNANIVAVGTGNGGNENGDTGGTNGCHGDFVSSEFNQK